MRLLVEITFNSQYLTRYVIDKYNFSNNNKKMRDKAVKLLQKRDLNTPLVVSHARTKYQQATSCGIRSLPAVACRQSIQLAQDQFTIQHPGYLQSDMNIA